MLGFGLGSTTTQPWQVPRDIGIEELVGKGTKYKDFQHGEKNHLCVGVGGRPHHQGIAQVLKAIDSRLRSDAFSALHWASRNLGRTSHKGLGNAELHKGLGNGQQQQKGSPERTQSQSRSIKSNELTSKRVIAPPPGYGRIGQPATSGRTQAWTIGTSGQQARSGPWQCSGWSGPEQSATRSGPWQW